MEEQQNNGMTKVLIGVIVVIIAAVAILFATGTISFNKENNANNNNNTTDNTKNDTEKDNTSSNYAPWMNYLLKQDILKASIHRTEYVDGVNNIDKTVNLSIDQIKGLFTKLMNYKLVKWYEGGRGFTYGDELTITYSKNGKSYDFEMQFADIVGLNGDNVDSELLTALENSEHTVENESRKNEPGWYYIYSFSGSDTNLENLYDEYFK